MVKKSNSADKTEPNKGKVKVGKLKVNKETVKDLTNSKAKKGVVTTDIFSLACGGACGGTKVL